ncbi:flagellar hook-basal body protein [Sulfoacidibacillus ferrooxidans]|uniref:Flagellar basal-body rod protein FlgG n=1 Tax=Sulfoacidibacillus ferrooxidans TaxID=2005001 RepID=A0A9X1V7N7_9BACL|nr:flagellar hook-basal body protein [Sulfoacidibacillus ferrooxidans]MCI0182778.1 Flagellar basal-body rod protein FlgG [Sulfoacidibacillus ferrooxidans]
MPIALDSATSGMNAFQQMMDVIGNNIANVNTTGYKSSSTTFEDLLSQTMSGGSAGTSSGIGGTNPVQVGLGTQVASIYSNFAEGSLQNTGNPDDLAINGSGFFMLSPVTGATSGISITGSNLYYTRAGDFHVDSNGYLVNPNGYYLMGVSGSGGVTNSSTLTAIQISGTGSEFTIGASGLVTVIPASGSNYSYNIALANVTNPDGLIKAGDSLYEANGASPAAGPNSYSEGDSSGMGGIQQGALEGSNVNLTSEMSNMIVAQTGYESNSKVINTENQMDQFMLQQV